MGQILTLDTAKTELNQISDPIILVGGCFDVIHPGHIRFLSEAKKIGGTLVVMLESDKKISSLKGPSRPIHSQQDRAYILSHLSVVDYILLLPYLKSHDEYDKVIILLKPTYIAVTKDDPVTQYAKHQAKLTNAELKIVTPRVSTHASTKIIKELNI